jgi:hypothetical protein
MAAAKKDVKKETGLALKHKKVSRRRTRRALFLRQRAVLSCALVAKRRLPAAARGADQAPERHAAPASSSSPGRRRRAPAAAAGRRES